MSSGKTPGPPTEIRDRPTCPDGFAPKGQGEPLMPRLARERPSCRPRVRSRAVRHRPGRARVRARHRRHDGGVQHLQRRPAGAAPVPRPGRARGGVRHAAGLRDVPGLVSEIPRLEDPQPGVRRDGRIDAGVVRADRPRRSRAGARPGHDRVARATCFGMPPQFGRWYNEQRGSGRRPEGRRPLAPVLGPVVEPRPAGGRAHADLRRRAVRGHRRDARAALRIATRELFVPLQRRLDPPTAASLPRDLCAPQAGGALERATSEMRALGPAIAAEFGHNHGIDVRSLYRGHRRQHPHAAAGPARRRPPRPADRVRQRREPAAGVRPGATPRAGDSAGARRRPRRRRAPAHGRSAASSPSPAAPSACCWRLDRPDVRDARRQRAPARRHDADRRPRAGVHSRGVPARRRGVRSLAAAAAADARPRTRRARGGYAHRQRNRERRLATASSSRRLPWRSRCSSAPGCW